MLCWVLHCFVDRAHIIDSDTSLLEPGDVLLVQIAPPHILVRTAVATLSGRHSVTLRSEICVEAWLNGRALRLLTLDLLCWLVEVLGGVVCSSKRGAIEVIEHEVHALCSSILKIVPHFDVSVDLNLDVGISLA